MVKLVLDTNVFVSGFLWEGNEAELIRKIERKEIMNFINKAARNPPLSSG
jgi:predicted nucleic acid-binding protein